LRSRGWFSGESGNIARRNGNRANPFSTPSAASLVLLLLGDARIAFGLLRSEHRGRAAAGLRGGVLGSSGSSGLLRGLGGGLLGSESGRLLSGALGRGGFRLAAGLAAGLLLLKAGDHRRVIGRRTGLEPLQELLPGSGGIIAAFVEGIFTGGHPRVLAKLAAPWESADLHGVS
jgi:hypothetical protein